MSAPSSSASPPEPEGDAIGYLLLAKRFGNAKLRQALSGINYMALTMGAGLGPDASLHLAWPQEGAHTPRPSRSLPAIGAIAPILLMLDRRTRVIAPSGSPSGMTSTRARLHRQRDRQACSRQLPTSQGIEKRARAEQVAGRANLRRNADRSAPEDAALPAFRPDPSEADASARPVAVRNSHDSAPCRRARSSASQIDERFAGPPPMRRAFPGATSSALMRSSSGMHQDLACSMPTARWPRRSPHGPRSKHRRDSPQPARRKLPK